MERSEEIWKKMKPIMQKAGCDMVRVRNLQKAYDRTQKQLPAVAARYRAAREAAMQVQALAGDLEQLLLAADIEDKAWGKQVTEIGKKFKKLRGVFEHEFLISAADKEFYLTYDALVRLAGQLNMQLPDLLIMRSENENLLDLLKENLERPQPDLWELSFFYVSQTDKELADLPPMERIQLLKNKKREQFIMPLGQQIGIAVKYVVARYKQLEGNESRHAVAEREELRLLYPMPQTTETANVLIRQLLNQLCTVNGQG